MVDDGGDIFELEEDVAPKSTRRLGDSEIRFVFVAESLQNEIQRLINERKGLENEDIYWADSTIADLQFRLDAVMKLLATPFDRINFNFQCADPMQMDPVGRWKIYSIWKQRAVKALQDKVNDLEARCRLQVDKVKDVDTLATAELIQGADIVGITTTGAAKQRALLASLKSKIGKEIFHFLLFV